MARLAENVLLRDSAAAAKKARLRYVEAGGDGIERRGRPGRFSYFDAKGRRVRSATTLARIASLAIPPAWRDVWICASPHGHVQATGHDAKGRKQYRYHAEWRKVRDHAKYADIVPFVHALPRLRRAVARDLGRSGVGKPRLVAAVVRLLDRTPIRIGNERYAQENDSYGLTTLRKRHAVLSGDTLKLRFRGKSRTQWQTDVRDRTLASVVKEAARLRGRPLFQYRDERGRGGAVSSSDVNAYIQEHMGAPFSAKEFRTLAGTLSACKLLFGSEPCASARHGKGIVLDVLDHVAEELGNTRAVCRKSYVEPLLFDRYLEGELTRPYERCLAQARRGRMAGLTVDERALVLFLESVGRGAPRKAATVHALAARPRRASSPVRFAARRSQSVSSRYDRKRR